MDKAWWDEYLPDVRARFAGALATTSGRLAGHGIRPLQRDFPNVLRVANSGATAIGMAIALGASRVRLLGYDCATKGSLVHWHGNHPSTLGNAGSMYRWPKLFRTLARSVPRSVEVLNCSRETALDCFARASLESVL